MVMTIMRFHQLEDNRSGIILRSCDDGIGCLNTVLCKTSKMTTYKCIDWSQKHFVIILIVNIESTILIIID